MNELVTLLLTLAIVILGGGMLFAYLQMGREEDRALAKRVDRAIHKPAVERRTAASVGTPSWVVAAQSWLRLPFTYGIGRTWGITLAPWWTILLAVSGAVAAWLLLRTLFHIPYWGVLPGMVVAGLFLPRYIMLQQRRRADTRFMAAFPDAVDMIVRMVRSGLPVAAAIRTVGQKASPVVGIVFAHIADRCEIGVPLEEALSDMSEEIGLADFRFFAVTLGLQRATGGNLARTLETFGEIIRKRRAIRLKAVAATAEVRMSAIVLGGIPIFVVGMLALVNPGYLEPMISDPRGNVLVGVAVMNMVLGGLSMRWLVRSGTVL